MAALCILRILLPISTFFLLNLYLRNLLGLFPVALPPPPSCLNCNNGGALLVGTVVPGGAGVVVAAHAVFI